METPVNTTNAFLATFLSAVASVLKWGGAKSFTDAVVACSRPSTVLGHFTEAGYKESAVTPERLLDCARSLLKPDKPPVIFAIGTHVQYTGEDYSAYLDPHLVLLVTDVEFGNTTIRYTVDGVEGVPHTDLAFLAYPTAESLEEVSTNQAQTGYASPDNGIDSI